MQNGNVITKDELLAYLKDWLTNHILYTDKKLGEYINQAK
jgi:hemerythrin